MKKNAEKMSVLESLMYQRRGLGVPKGKTLSGEDFLGM